MAGGVIGVTTAYWLAKTGHEVHVLERNSGVGEETSFQNGALLAVIPSPGLHLVPYGRLPNRCFRRIRR
jgi:glycine/D-amino acid oxidase-like deaminating enzyme